MTRICGIKTVAGHGCMNLVSDDGDHCAAGHPRVPIGVSAGSPISASGHDVVAFLQEPEAFEVEQLVALVDTTEIWEEWHQPGVAPFDAPEFYAPEVVVSVHCGDEIIGIEGEGDRCWERQDETGALLLVEDPEEFRERFPNGKLPADGENGWAVVNNGWLTLYQIPGNGPTTEDVFFSLTEAVEYAQDMLRAYAGTA